MAPVVFGSEIFFQNNHRQCWDVIKTFSLSELEMAASAPFSLIVERDKEFVSQGKTIADFAVELQPIAAIA